MSLKQEVMNLIMSGRCSGIKINELDEKDQNIIYPNYFLYQGDYFDAYSDQALLKSLSKISLINIDSVEATEEGDYLVKYSSGMKLLLIV